MLPQLVNLESFLTALRWYLRAVDRGLCTEGFSCLDDRLRLLIHQLDHTFKPLDGIAHALSEGIQDLFTLQNRSERERHLNKFTYIAIC